MCRFLPLTLLILLCVSIADSPQPVHAEVTTTRIFVVTETSVTWTAETHINTHRARQVQYADEAGQVPVDPDFQVNHVSLPYAYAGVLIGRDEVTIRSSHSLASVIGHGSAVADASSVSADAGDGAPVAADMNGNFRYGAFEVMIAPEVQWSDVVIVTETSVSWDSRTIIDASQAELVENLDGSGAPVDSTFQVNGRALPYACRGLRIGRQEVTVRSSHRLSSLRGHGRATCDSSVKSADTGDGAPVEEDQNGNFRYGVFRII